MAAVGDGGIEDSRRDSSRMLVNRVGLVQGGNVGLAKILDGGRGQAGHVDAARGHEVDALVRPHSGIGFRVDAGQGKESVLARDEGKVPVGPVLVHGLGQQAAHFVDAVAHGGEFDSPGRVQFPVCQDARHNSGSVGGRTRPQGTGMHFQLAQHGVGCRTEAEGGQGPSSFVVQAEVLGVGTGNQDWQAGIGQHAHPGCIEVQAPAESLVGQVHQYLEAAFLGQSGQALPVVRFQVQARRVVAASVHQYHITGRNRGPRCEHLLPQDRVGFGIEVRICAHRQAGLLRNLGVVGPGWIAQPHRGVRPVLGHQFAGQAQGAGAARCVQRDAVRGGSQGMIRTQQEAAHRFAEVGGAVDRQIVLGVLVGQDALLCGFDRVQYRNVAGGILVDPHAQIQLLRIGIRVARGGEVVDRIGRDRLDVGEDVHEAVRYTDGSGDQIAIG